MLDFLSLIGSYKTDLDKVFADNGFKLEQYEDYGEYSYAVYSNQSEVLREIRVKFYMCECGAMANTFIVS